MQESDTPNQHDKLGLVSSLEIHANNCKYIYFFTELKECYQDLIKTNHGFLLRRSLLIYIPRKNISTLSCLQNSLQSLEPLKPSIYKLFLSDFNKRDQLIF